MAKRCPKCDRSYPDDQPVCPYCEPAAATGEQPDEEDIFASLWSGDPSAPPSSGKDLGPADDVMEITEAEEPLTDADWSFEHKAEAEGSAAPAPEEPEAPAPPRSATPTQLASRTPTPTMLAPADTSQELPGSELGGPAAPKADAGPPAQQPAASGETPRQATPTRLAGRGPTPTMLAPTDAPQELPGSELSGLAGPKTADEGAPPPSSAAPTKLAGRGPSPTMLAPSEDAGDAGEPQQPPPSAKEAKEAKEAPPYQFIDESGADVATPKASEIASNDIFAAEEPLEAAAPASPDLGLDSGHLKQTPAKKTDEDAVPLAKTEPNLSLDSGKLDSGILDAQPVDEDEELVEVTEASGIGLGQPPAKQMGPESDIVVEAEEVTDEDGADLVDADEVLEAAAPSGVDLKAQPGRGKPADEEAEGLDFIEEAVEAEDDEPDFLDENVLVEGASEVDLGKKGIGKAEFPSGVDVIAEALESGVDLGPESPEAATSKAKKKDEKPAGDVDYDEFRARDIESSSVDLGATTAEMAAVAAGKQKSGVQPGEVEVDSGLLLDEPSGARKEKAGAEELDEDAAADLLMDDAPSAPASGRDLADADADDLLAEAAAEEAAEAPAEEEDDELFAAPKARGKGRKAAPVHDEDGEEVAKPKYGRRWAGGVLVGMLLTVGAAGGAWYFQPDLLDMIPESPNAEKKAALVSPAADNTLRDQLTKEKADREAQDAKITGIAKVLVDAKLVDAKQLDDPQKLDVATVEGIAKDLAGARKLVVDVGTLLKAKQDEIPKKIEELNTANKEQEDKLTGIAKVLVDAKQLDEPQKLDAKTVEGLVKDLAGAKKVVSEVETALDVKEEVVKKVEELRDAGKDLGDKMAQVNKSLKDAKITEPDAKGVEKLAASREKLEKEKAALDEAVTQALKELAEGEARPAADPKEQLVKDAAALREKAKSPLVSSLTQLATDLSELGAGAGEMLDAIFDRTAVEAQLRFYQTREPLIQAPQQKLDTWMALFQDRDNKQPKEVAQAVKDAQWVMSAEAKAGPDAKAKAVCVEGLMLRNQGKFAEAREKLTEAVKQAEALKAGGPWATMARQALAELTDPAAYYLPRAQKLYAEGQYKAALDDLDTGLKAIPDESRMLVLRSQVRLDQAQSEGKLGKEQEQLVRADAEAAKKDEKTAAAGYYVLGRLEEQLQQWDKAEKNYRDAMKANRGGADEASRYRIALGRLLQRERPASAPVEPEPKTMPPAADGVSEEGAGPVNADADLTAQIFLAVTAVQLPDEDEDPVTAGRLKESINLAKELIESDNPKVKGEGYMILGQAYTKQGKRTEGLQVYVKGLTLVHPDATMKDLHKMVQEHPAFQQPDSITRPNPVLAESHFGKGLHLYNAHDYALAEEYFKKAVSLYNQDARYQYFLGLSRLGQNTRLKREAAYHDFEIAGRLEAEGRPSSAEVNSSLERVQGSLRQYVNRFRQRSLAAAE